jgi:hypothetical protein
VIDETATLLAELPPHAKLVPFLSPAVFGGIVVPFSGNLVETSYFVI